MATRRQRALRRAVASTLLVGWIFFHWTALVSFPVSAQGFERETIRLVLAHYMVCCGRFGHQAGISEYESEMADASRLGIDGFLLDLASWRAEPYYRTVTENLFLAAERSGTNFKLALLIEGLSVDEAVEAVSAFFSKSSYLYFHQRPVVATYGGDGHWGDLLTGRLHALGIDIFFVPFYYYGHADFAAKLDPDGIDVYDAKLALRDAPNIDGYFYFGAGGPPKRLAKDMGLVTELMHRAKKISVVGIAPFYKGFGPKNSRIFESNGFLGMQSQWLSAISARADWVNIVTWNDWGEATYVAPLSGPVDAIWNSHWGNLLAHEKFLEASRYYIDWFKTGIEPELKRDAIYYFYRVHPKTSMGLIQPSIDQTTTGRPFGWENLNDEIFFTSFLVRPLTLQIENGGHSYILELPKGVSTKSVPMSLGTIEIHLKSERIELTTKKLEFAIGDDGTSGNFNYFSGGLSLDPSP